MKIKDIDFDNEVINIYQKKTDSFKTIPLSNQLIELINELLESGNGENIYKLKDNETYLFSNQIKKNLNLKLRKILSANSSRKS